MSATPGTPTRSEPAPHEWTARETGPRRSIFGNYTTGTDAAVAVPAAPPAGSATAELAVARAFVYRFLALAFEYPSPDRWSELIDEGGLEGLVAAADSLADAGIRRCCEDLRQTLPRADREAHHDRYVSAFGHAARGSIPMNEIEYGEPRADALYQPHRLADLAAFYRAFGLSVAGDSGERHDHLCLQLEFISVLAAKEAWAMRGHADAEALAVCRQGTRDFLREHAGRWIPAFCRMVVARADAGALAPLAALLRAVIEVDCGRYGVPAGPDTLVVRLSDEAAERLCDGCGLRQAPPGAEPAPE